MPGFCLRIKKIEPISKLWISAQGKASRELKAERTLLVREYFNVRDNADMGA